MTTYSSVPVLVTGGTGKQGGAVARALLAQGATVRALVRDPHSPRAEALQALGADLVLGDLEDRASLVAASAGAGAVFSVQMPDTSNPYSDAEKVQGENLVAAARASGVSHFVHTSASGAGDYRDAPGWAEGRWSEHHLAHYWESKAHVEGLVRDAGFPHWTIIRPCFFMENFVRPSFLFANWVEDRLLTAILPDTRVALVAVQDIGAAGAAAIGAPETFSGIELELAGDLLTMREIAAILSSAMGIALEAPSLSVAEAVGQGMMPALVVGQEWINIVGSPARPARAQSLGLPTTDFKTWAQDNLRTEANVLRV